jgi:peroxiredoxin
MHQRVANIWMIGLMTLAATVMAVAPAAADEEPSGEKGQQAELGKEAPALTLSDSDGQKHALTEYRGRIVILEWLDPECLFDQRLYRSGTMQETYKKVRELDEKAIWLAVNSTPGVTAKQMRFWKNLSHVEHPILLDTWGEAAELYDPRRTPHMFVIDAKGVLRYHGAIDDNPLGQKKASQVTNYVIKAVGQLVKGDAVSPNHVKPYGCAIKTTRREK